MYYSLKIFIYVTGFWYLFLPVPRYFESSNQIFCLVCVMVELYFFVQTRMILEFHQQPELNYFNSKTVFVCYS